MIAGCFSQSTISPFAKGDAQPQHASSMSYALHHSNAAISSEVLDPCWNENAAAVHLHAMEREG